MSCSSWTRLQVHEGLVGQNGMRGTRNSQRVLDEHAGAGAHHRCLRVPSLLLLPSRAGRQRERVESVLSDTPNQLAIPSKPPYSTADEGG